MKKKEKRVTVEKLNAAHDLIRIAIDLQDGVFDGAQAPDEEQMTDEENTAFCEIFLTIFEYISNVGIIDDDYYRELKKHFCVK